MDALGTKHHEVACCGTDRHQVGSSGFFSNRMLKIDQTTSNHESMWSKAKPGDACPAARSLRRTTLMSLLRRRTLHYTTCHHSYATLGNRSLRLHAAWRPRGSSKLGHGQYPNSSSAKRVGKLGQYAMPYTDIDAIKYMAYGLRTHLRLLQSFRI